MTLRPTAGAVGDICSASADDSGPIQHATACGLLCAAIAAWAGYRHSPHHKAQCGELCTAGAGTPLARLRPKWTGEPRGRKKCGIKPCYHGLGPRPAMRVGEAVLRRFPHFWNRLEQPPWLLFLCCGSCFGSCPTKSPAVAPYFLARIWLHPESSKFWRYHHGRRKNAHPHPHHTGDRT